MDWVPIGKVAKTHGLKGELKFYPFFQDIDICREVKKVRVSFTDDRQFDDEIESLRGHHAPFIIKLKSRHSIEDAQEIRGCEVLAARSDIKPPPDGKRYWFEVLDLEVFDTQGRFYGHVKEVLETGSNDVYVVRSENNEILLPAIDWVIQSIDIENKKLIFNAVEGLLESNAL